MPLDERRMKASENVGLVPNVTRSDGVLHDYQLKSVLNAGRADREQSD